jgi:hypothetical protein
MAYELKLNIEQNDFNRYIAQGEYYTIEELNSTNAIVKAQLKSAMDYLNGFKGQIYVRVLDSNDYNVSIVFDFELNDVYFLTKSKQGLEKWSAMLMFGEQNSNHINLTHIDETKFKYEIEIPTKLIILMYYPDVFALINKCQKQLTATKQTSNKLIEEIKNAQKELEQKQAESKANDSTKQDEKVEKTDDE